MKIALIIHRLNVRGGAQRQAIYFARELKKLGHDVTFYPFYFDKEKCFPELLGDFRIVSLTERFPGWDRKITRFWKIFSRPSYLVDLAATSYGARLMSTLVDRETEILNPISYRAHWVTYFYKKNIKQIPSVWMINTFPLQGWAGILKRRYDSPARKIMLFCTDWYESLKYGRAHDEITVLDERDNERTKKYFNKEAVVVRSGVDLDQFSFTLRRLNPEKITLLSVGIFSPRRRFEDVIEAVRILRERGYRVGLDIVGNPAPSPEYYQKLSALVTTYSLDEQVHFLGRLALDQELIDCYHTRDIYISANHMESWGLAIFEAMACGMPVVVSRSSGACAVLTDGRDAMLADPKSPESIASAVERLIHDPELFRSVSKNSRVCVEENISWAKYTASMLAVFERAQLSFRT